MSNTERGYVITAKGYVGRVALHEKFSKSIGHFNADWQKFEDWLCETKPELIGTTIPTGEFDKLVDWFREFKKAS